MATLSSPGIGSGLDVNGIVQKLMTVEQQPLTQLDKQTAVDQAKVSAFGTLKSALSALQTALQGLSTSSAMHTMKATTSADTVFSATAGNGAVAGTYSVEVTQLARAQKLASAGFATTADTLGAGTLTFDFGTTTAGVFTPGGTGARTVTIAPGQDTLAGIRDAVNAANIGVTATIVNDGSAAGNRLVFTSTATGAANSMRITVTDADGNATDAAGLSQLAYDPAAAAGAGRNLTEKVVAQDALLTLDGIAVSSASNTLTNAIDGVTLNLRTTNAGTPATLTVGSDVGSVGAAVSAFVKSYNDLDTTFDNLTKYDASKKQASVLTGDTTVRMVQTQLRTLLGGTLGSGAYSTLSQVGVRFQTDGTLALDAAKLNAAITADADGVTQLFAAVGTSSDSLVSVSGFTSKTVPGTYALDVSQLATHGTLVGQAAAGLTITAGVNDTLSVLLDGVSTTVTLGAGTYATADALALEIQSRINGDTRIQDCRSDRHGNAVRRRADVDVGALRLGVVDRPDRQRGGGSSRRNAGRDGGPRHGRHARRPGRCSARAVRCSAWPVRPTKASSLNIAGGALGPRGSVTYQTGFAYRLNDLVKNVIGSDGAIAARTDGLQKDIARIDKRREALNARLAQVEANYRAQFNALDTLLSNLSAQSTALAQQLANLPTTSCEQQVIGLKGATGWPIELESKIERIPPPCSRNAPRRLTRRSASKRASPPLHRTVSSSCSMTAHCKAIGEAMTHAGTGNVAARGAALSRALAIIDEGLKASVDVNAGGAIARHLVELYDYMTRRLLLASIRSDAPMMGEVAGLLRELRDAWAGIEQPAGAAAPAPSYASA